MFEIRQSPLNGRGLFAKRDIRKGEIVVRWENTRELTSDEYKDLCQDDLTYIDIQDGHIFLVGEPERFVNHSCDPSTTFGHDLGLGCDIANRDILEGEEVTSDYAQFCNPNRDFICNCQAKNCRGHIDTGKI